MSALDLEYDGFTLFIDDIAIKSTLFIAVSGAHAYGWARPDSDLDIRRVYFPSLPQTISPFFQAKTKQRMRKSERGIIDFTVYPIRDYLRLLDKGNGNFLENLFQHHLYKDDKLVKELQQIILDNLHLGFLKHYSGYATSLFKDMDNPTRLKKYGMAKLVLNCYRVLLAGLILNSTGKVVYNLSEQEKYRKTDYCSLILGRYLNNEHSMNKISDKPIKELIKLSAELDSYIYETPNLPSAKLVSPTVRLDRWLCKYYQKL